MLSIHKSRTAVRNVEASTFY